MKRPFRKTFFLLTVLFYIPASLSISASDLGSLVNNFDNNSDIPICGCEDGSSCCDALCCAPKVEEAAASSCCGSSEPEHVAEEEAPFSLQMAWKASCTCGGSHAEHGLLLSDPQHLPLKVENTFWLPAFAKNSFFAPNWTSMQPLPPEQVPKTFL